MSIVKTTLGALQGIHKGAFITFKGIPYAKPPLGKLRFKAPEPPEKWEGVRVASDHGPICPQYNERLDRIEAGSEDCLYLNVYTPTIDPHAPLPVMVWIHGGGFYTGSGNSDFYGPEFLMSQNIILVTFNYRLEVLGFLCLDCDEAPGNAGLKDQVAALKWIKDNISNFGGDDNNITIFGCSAGSAAVSFHLISDMSKGLFNKAICQSGVCLNEWSYNIHPQERAYQLGKLLGKDTKESKELLEFLYDVPALSLVNIKLPSLENKFKDVTDGIFFGPVIEKRYLKVNKFITESPPDLLEKGLIADVPLILGYTTGEGIELARNLPYTLEFMKCVGSVVPRELKLKLSEEKVKEIDEKIRRYYHIGNDSLSIDKIQEISNLESDRLFLYNIRRFAKYHDQFCTNPVYLYEFAAETERNFNKKRYRMEAVKGVCHADEIPYLFNITCPEIPLTDDSQQIINKFVELWTNFARTGTPTLMSSDMKEHWKRYKGSEENYFIINRSCVCSKYEGIANFMLWDNIYKEMK